MTDKKTPPTIEFDSKGMATSDGPSWTSNLRSTNQDTRSSGNAGVSATSNSVPAQSNINMANGEECRDGATGSDCTSEIMPPRMNGLGTGSAGARLNSADSLLSTFSSLEAVETEILSAVSRIAASSASSPSTTEQYSNAHVSSSIAASVLRRQRKSAIGLRHGMAAMDQQPMTSFDYISPEDSDRSLPRRAMPKKEDGFNCGTRTLACSIEKQEQDARNNAESRLYALQLYRVVAALKVFMYYFITMDSIFSSLVGSALTVYCYFQLKDDNGGMRSGSVDRMLLTFAVITPITLSVRMAFARREKALIEITKIRSFSFQIYMAHAAWDWHKEGKNRKSSGKDWLQHSDMVMGHLIGIGDELCRFLLLPTSSRGRHRFLKTGRKEATITMELAYHLFESIHAQRLTRLTMSTEILKEYGLTESECSRIRNYERPMGEAIENLRLIKSYRTPEALRTFARIFALILPPLYSPSFAQIAIDVGSLGLGITLSVVTTLGLAALFESIEVLEDPFVGYTELDGIDVKEELSVLHWQSLVNAREIVFPSALPYPTEPQPALTTGLEGTRHSFDQSKFFKK